MIGSSSYKMWKSTAWPMMAVALVGPSPSMEGVSRHHRVPSSRARSPRISPATDRRIVARLAAHAL
jgi:hypothetical protein